jgi:hypothetical protein
MLGYTVFFATFICHFKNIQIWNLKIQVLTISQHPDSDDLYPEGEVTRWFWKVSTNLLNKDIKM